jgi:Holliday junction resolvase RusA-like endonuclease
MRESEGSYERSPLEDIDDQDDAQDIVFFVAGDPQPKGSTRAFYVKKLDRVVTTTTNKNTKQWQLRIAMEAQHANELRPLTFFSPHKDIGYEVEAHFLFVRPKSLPKKIRMDTKRPDLDKLVRAVLDGLADILIPDDAQVISIVASKRYADEGETPGARIMLRKVR